MATVKRLMDHLGRRWVKALRKYFWSIPQRWTVASTRVNYQNHSKLPWLESEISIMREVTGRGLYCSTLGGEPLTPSHVNIWVSAKDIRYEELLDIYKASRRILKLSNKRKFKDVATDLYKEVQKRGGPVTGTEPVSFWEGIRKSGIKNRDGNVCKD